MKRKYICLTAFAICSKSVEETSIDALNASAKRFSSSVAERFSESLSSSPALTASWICSSIVLRSPVFKILSHACKIANWFLLIGILNDVMFHLNYLFHYP